MTIKRENRIGFGVMIYPRTITTHAHNTDKPHAWGESTCWMLWVGYGLGSLVVEFRRSC